MASKQVQIRRDTSGNLAASTPATGEVGYDTTNKRLIVGDGSTAGGIKHLNYLDHVNNTFVYSSAGGTANAITVTLSPALTSYATPTRIIFKATATNTTATTINVNGLGAKNLYKFTAGTLGAIVAGDIVNGGIYEVIYDGTQFQLLTLQNAGITSVSQGQLNTSTGTFSATPSTPSSASDWGSVAAVLLPSGQYGFMIESSVNSADFSGDNFGAWVMGRNSTSYGAYVQAVNFGNTNSRTIQGRQRYVTSSPPFDIDGKEAGGFMFLLLNNSGEVISHYFADVPPWGYNGPTNICCDKQCPTTGKKYAKNMKPRTFEEIMDGAKIEFELQEITMEMKNADMDLIPHPFEGHAADEHVVMIDPYDDRVFRMKEYQNAGGSQEIMDQITKGYIRVDNTKTRIKGPKGVAVHRMAYQYGKKSV